MQQKTTTRREPFLNEAISKLNYMRITFWSSEVNFFMQHLKYGRTHKFPTMRNLWKLVVDVRNQLLQSDQQFTEVSRIEWIFD